MIYELLEGFQTLDLATVNAFVCELLRSLCVQSEAIPFAEDRKLDLEGEFLSGKQVLVDDASHALLFHSNFLRHHSEEMFDVWVAEHLLQKRDLSVTLDQREQLLKYQQEAPVQLGLLD